MIGSSTILAWRSTSCASCLPRAISFSRSERNFGVGIAHQVLTDPVHILGDDRVIDDFGLALDFLRQLLAEGDFFLPIGTELWRRNCAPGSDRPGSHTRR